MVKKKERKSPANVASIENDYVRSLQEKKIKEVHKRQVYIED